MVKRLRYSFGSLEDQKNNDRARRMVTITLPPEDKEPSLFDFLSAHIGAIDGTTEALSENCGQRFSEGLLEGY